MASFYAGEVFKFLHIPAGLHTKMADGFKGHIFRQHTDIEYAGFFNHFPGQISHLHGYRQLGRVISHLEAGVGDAAVVFARFPGAEDKQAVA